jgi:hypothetical protein
LANILMIGRVGFIPMLRWVGISIFTVGQYPMIGWLYFHCHLMFPWCAWLINQIIVGVIASIRLFQPHHCWWTSDSLQKETAWEEIWFLRGAYYIMGGRDTVFCWQVDQIADSVVKTSFCLVRIWNLVRQIAILVESVRLHLLDW